METKTGKAEELLVSGKYKECLGIMKGFNIGLNKSERDIIKRGYECFVWPDFYRQINVDIEKAKKEGIGVAERYFEKRRKR